MEVVASLSQGRTAAARCCLFAYTSVPVIFEPPCIFNSCLSEGAACSVNSTTDRVSRAEGQLLLPLYLAMKFMMRFELAIVKVFPVQAGQKKE